MSIGSSETCVKVEKEREEQKHKQNHKPEEASRIPNVTGRRLYLKSRYTFRKAGRKGMDEERKSTRKTLRNSKLDPAGSQVTTFRNFG